MGGGSHFLKSILRMAAIAGIGPEPILRTVADLSADSRFAWLGFVPETDRRQGDYFPLFSSTGNRTYVALQGVLFLYLSIPLLTNLWPWLSGRDTQSGLVSDFVQRRQTGDPGLDME
jgi:hypothetical protein